MTKSLTKATEERVYLAQCEGTVHRGREVMPPGAITLHPWSGSRERKVDAGIPAFVMVPLHV